MGDPWEELERFSDPELIELVRNFNVKFSEEEMKIVEDRLNAAESSKFKLYIALPIFTLVGFCVNGITPFILIKTYSEYPTYALTHTAAVLA
ncbi:MAG: hypothetical protein ABGW50_05770, partial [Thermococcus sp.]